MMPLDPMPMPPPAPITPPTVTPDPLAILPLPTDGPNTLEAWTERIKASEEELDPIVEKGRQNIEAYNGKTLDKTPEVDTVIVNKDFSNVERKKPELFGQVPAIQLKAELPGLDQAVYVFQAVVNKYLSTKGVNAAAMMDECLFDVLCPTGFAACKIGYEAYQDGTKQVPTGKMIPDPNAPPPMPQPGSILGLQQPAPPPLVPELVDVPNIVYEKYFVNRISPAKFRKPTEFAGSNFDDAAWLGQAFVEDAEIGRQKYHLPPDFNKTTSQDEDRLVTEPDTARPKEVLRGHEIWYKAHLFDPTEKHPLKLRQLVLIDGYDQPVVHRDSPYQEMNDKGELMGMTGFPIHVLTLRYVSDTAFPPADCTIGRATTAELSKGRSQMVQQRERSYPLRWVNLEAIGGQPTLDKINAGTWQGLIPVTGNGAEMMGQIATATFPRENFEFNRISNEDNNELWGFGNAQRGQESDGGETATAQNIRQQSTNVRMGLERAKVARFFVGVAEKLASLIQLFATDQDYVALEGQQGQQQLQAWDKTTIAGKFAFSVAPDSTIQLDAAQDKRDALKEYQLLANDPFFDPVDIRMNLARKMGLDPSKIKQPPPKPMDVPKLNYSFQGPDLDPSLPQFPIVMEILRAGGVQVSPDAIQAAQQHAIMLASMGMGAGAAKDSGKTPPPTQPNNLHPGTTSEVSPIGKHHFDLTGERPGAPAMPAGVQ